jgi:hypothetical protein
LGVSADLSIACLSDLLMLLVFGEKSCLKNVSFALRPQGPIKESSVMGIWVRRQRTSNSVVVRGR